MVEGGGGELQQIKSCVWMAKCEMPVDIQAEVLRSQWVAESGV